MSNNMRHRREQPKQKMFAVDSAQVIEIGDFLWQSTDDVRAASDYVWDTDIATTQRSFIKLFAGVAGDKSDSGDTDDIAVETAGIVEMTCEAAQFEVGDLVGIAKASGNELEDQKIVAVASHDLAIGKVIQRHSSNTTTVLIEIFPRISQTFCGSINNKDIDGDEGYVKRLVAGTYITVKSNQTAVVDPTVNDDISAGYVPGSSWANVVLFKMFACVTNTLGAAIWLEILTGVNWAKLGINKSFVANYTVINADDVAGLTKIDTGFAATPDGWLVNILRAGVEVKTDAVVTALGGGDLGKIQVADGAATYALTVGDVIYMTAWDKV